MGDVWNLAGERFKAKTAQVLIACIDAAVSLEVLHLSTLDWRLGLHGIAFIGAAMSLFCLSLALMVILKPLRLGFMHFMLVLGIS